MCGNSMDACEYLWMKKRRWVRELSSISPRTGLGMVIIAGGGSVLLIDLPISFPGHSSRMTISHFSPAKIHTKNHKSKCLLVFVCVRACVLVCQTFFTPRFPVVLNNSATLLSALEILDEILKC